MAALCSLATITHAKGPRCCCVACVPSIVHSVFLVCSGIEHITGIGRYKFLKRMSLKDNKIACLPDEMACLSQLTSLHLGCNKLTEFPHVLASLPLETLYLFDNDIARISGDTLGKLTRCVGCRGLRNCSEVWVAVGDGRCVGCPGGLAHTRRAAPSLLLVLLRQPIS